MEYSVIKAHAVALGIFVLDGKDLADYESMSDGCSGRLSWIYTLAGKKISCHRCCVAHDFLYEWGGAEADRKKADILLWTCAARAGSSPVGWVGKTRRAWRGFRALVMYGVARAWGKRYWGTP